MKEILNIKSILKTIKDSLPYLLLVSIYFFFVNIEARNNQTSIQKNSKFKDKIPDKEDLTLGKSANNQRISIPVIPYDN